MVTFIYFDFVIFPIADLESYLREMIETYQTIKESNKSLYVLRRGDDYDGSSNIFALENPQRSKDESGNIILSESDYAYLKKNLSPFDYEPLEKKVSKVELFDKPVECSGSRKENLTLSSLKKVLNGETAMLFLDY